jgi:DNA (cytosine-5)-methyltransferase 1
MSALKIGSLCSGFGGLDMSVMDVLDAEVAWHAQYDPDDKHRYAAKILAHHWPDVPNHGDITAIDWAAVEPVDVLTAGFPCQDLSLAGKRAGMREGNRSGLWFHVASAIEALRPSLVVIENVPGILSSQADGDMEPCPWCLGDLGRKRRPLRALGAVLADLARLGFDAEWLSLDAADVGAPHKRRRVFLAAWPAAVQDPDLPVGGERRLAAPGQAESRRARSDSGRRSGAPAAHARGFEPERRGGLAVLGGPAPAEQGEGHQRERAGDTLVDRREAPADANGAGTRSQPDREPHQPEADHEHEVGDSRGRVLDWGDYAPAIERWERVTGRPAPSPTEPGKTGQRLSPRFVEWMQGLPAGWVTGVGIPRNAELKALGNGVVRQQGAEALRRLLANAPAWLLEHLSRSLTERTTT